MTVELGSKAATGEAVPFLVGVPAVLFPVFLPLPGRGQDLHGHLRFLRALQLLLKPRRRANIVESTVLRALVCSGQLWCCSW